MSVFKVKCKIYNKTLVDLQHTWKTYYDEDIGPGYLKELVI